jgi:membrane protease YdiL (CAAX protease family)
MPQVGASSPSQESGRKLIVIYIAAAFSFAWLFWGLSWLYTKGFLASLPLIPIIVIGAFGPFVAAGLCAWLEGGPRFVARFFGRALLWRMGWAPFLLSVSLMPALAIIVEALHAYINHTTMRWMIPWSNLPFDYLWLFFFGGSCGEEFGWSYLSDKLDDYFSITRSTFIVGATWACWHLPLFYIAAPGLTQVYTPFPIFFFMVVAARFLYSWAYRRSGKSILANILFHTSVNFAYDIVAIAPTLQDSSRQKLWMFTILIAVSAVVLWRRFPLRRS